MSAKRITRLALFTAAALVLNIIESLLPPILPFAPGARMGFGNVVTLVAAIILGYTDAFTVLLLKCLLAAVFGGNLYSLTYSLPAGVISLAAEILVYHFGYRVFGVAGISLLGAVIFNFVQVVVASLTVGVSLAAMLPFMLVASVIAGLAVGVATFFTVKYLPRKFYADRLTL